MFPLLETVGRVSRGTVDKVSTFCNIMHMNSIDNKQFEDSARLLRVLGHSMRLAMVEALSERPYCVCELADSLGLNKSAASKHLSLLKSVGVIDMERDGTQVNCTLVMSCVLEMMHCANREQTIYRKPRSKEISEGSNDSKAETVCCNTNNCKPKKEKSLMVKTKIMFVCIHNSARSQMCEAFVRHYAADKFDVHSSGIEAGKLNPLVVQAMAEIDISMDGQYAKQAKEYIDRKEAFDYVVTVCDESSAERCPMFPGKHTRMHWGFPDPSAIRGTDEEKLAGIRPIRDDIQRKVKEWLQSFNV